MNNERNWLGQARYYSSVIALQVTALLFSLYLFQPWWRPPAPIPAVVVVAQPASPPPTVKVTSGVPTRIFFPRLNIDLPVDDGLYDAKSQTWTLSGLRAQFATISQPANDYGGGTFIYGHNNKHVFGRLTALVPGDRVEIHTGNKLIFSYIYEGKRDVKPTDVSALEYDGEPTLIVQTCSGSFNEWRRMYSFRLDNVQSAKQVADAT